VPFLKLPEEFPHESSLETIASFSHTAVARRAVPLKHNPAS